MSKKASRKTISAAQQAEAAAVVGPLGLTAAFGLAGIPQSTGYYWLSEGRKEGAKQPYLGFAQAIDRALAGAVGTIMGPMLQAIRPPAKRGPDDPPYDPKLACDAARWLAERRFPAEFGNRVRTEITGANGGPVESTSEVRGIVVLPMLDEIAETTHEATDESPRVRVAEPALTFAPTPPEPADRVVEVLQRPHKMPRPAASVDTDPELPPVDAPVGPPSPMAAVVARSHAEDGVRSRGTSW
jgi:hypothetical protein